MILGIIVLLCILLTGLLLQRKHTAVKLYDQNKVSWDHKYNSSIRAELSLAGTIIVTILFLAVNAAGYYSHVDDLESITRNKAVVTIYKDKSDTLTKQFVKYLMNYSDFEKDIYTQISPKDVDIYMVKYPELKSSTTVIALVDNIYKLQDDVYNTEIEIETHKKQLRARKRDPFLMTWLLPSE